MYSLLYFPRENWTFDDYGGGDQIGGIELTPCGTKLEFFVFPFWIHLDRELSPW
jgi:hypothetical protein